MKKMQTIKIETIIKAFEESARNPKNAPTDTTIVEMLETDESLESTSLFESLIVKYLITLLIWSSSTYELSPK